MPVHLCNHPLIQHCLTQMRDKHTGITEFRQLLDRIALLMAVEFSRTAELTAKTIETPMGMMHAPTLKEQPLVIVPILRAALGMVNGLLTILPHASVAHLGLERDEQTLKPRGYYQKFPSGMPEKDVLIVDPMLATGGSIMAAVEVLCSKGAKPERMSVLCLVSAPEGIRKVEASYPQMPIFTAAVDERLNDIGYIVPGLGDAGDRLFGTF